MNNTENPYKQNYYVNVRNYSDMIDLLEFCRNRTKLPRQAYLNVVRTQQEIQQHYQGCIIFKITTEPFSSRSKHACTLGWISYVNEGVDLPILRLMLEL